jgi:hypothetical protein
MCPHTGRRRVQCFALALTVATLGSGAVASAAGAASVKITMPSKVKRGTDYPIQVTGTYKPRELKGRAYLISAIQFANHPCKASAQAENRTRWYIQWYFTPKAERKLKNPKHVGIFVGKSPFTNTQGFTAGDLGTRHVCSWLYPKFIHASDTVAPIARADKKYRVTKN